MIKKINYEKEYFELSNDAWNRNSDFWIKNRRITPIIEQYLSEKVNTLNSSNIVDIGCGNGWLFEKLVKHKQKKYCGIDSNNHFISYLSNLYPDNEYHCIDFTKKINTDLFSKFNFAVSCLSLIEIVDIDSFFYNINMILEEKGVLILITLNPYFEIIRLNQNYDDLIIDFSIFREDFLPKYYCKEIIIDGKQSDKFYYGVLHTTEKLISAILKNEFIISEFKELCFIHGAINEPIYNSYVLTKKSKQL